MKIPFFHRKTEGAALRAKLARAELRTDRLRDEMAQRRRDLLRKTIEMSKGAEKADG
ncbi:MULTISPECIES: hypothetical protein [Phaeobacter]|uniref:hypothetical protein n=1 Tax=Phaeobacter TaxID=302485 RepID=UPI000CA16EC7|nr:hypothetical protein [Phaeobacter inhibens]AUQ62141.1 hypothetical protein PhaeoP51_01143 [Phaeobacter inhibens]